MWVVCIVMQSDRKCSNLPLGLVLLIPVDGELITPIYM